MRLTLALLAPTLLLPGLRCARAQDDDLPIPPAPIPRLPATGHKAADFAPRGWQVEKEVKGDLNSDGKPDLVFALKQASKALILHPADSPDALDTNPHLLGVAIAGPDGTFSLIAQNGTLVPRRTDERFQDVFDEGGIEVKKGVLAVDLYNFAMGSTETSRFLFRMQHGRLELIGYEWWAIQRALQDVEKTSINYSTGVALFSTEPHVGRGKTIRKQLPHLPLQTFEQIGNGIEFETPFTETQS